MFNPKKYRDKAADYAERAKTATGSEDAHESARLAGALHHSQTTSNGCLTITKRPFRLSKTACLM
jgi:hypothetical protein